MRSVGLVGVAIAMVCAGIAAVATAYADPHAREPVRIRVDENICVDGERFFRELSARTPWVRRADDTEAARTVAVAIATRSDVGGVTGRLRFEEEGQETKTRVFRASSCDEVVAAMALVAALSIDPGATAPSLSSVQAPADAGASSDVPTSDASSPVPIDSGAVLPDAAVTPPEPPVTAVPATASPVAHRIPAPAASIEEPPTSPGRAALEPTSRWLFAMGGSFEAATLQGLRFSPSVFLEVLQRTPGPYAPDVRLAAQRAEGTAVSQPEGTGKPLWLTLDLSLCPLRWWAGALAACADVEAGSLQVSATGTDTTSRARFWMAPGLEGRLAWPAMAIARRVSLVVDVELGLRAPVVRDTFHFLEIPNEFVVYTPPAIVTHAGLDLGLRFW
jgi:hypothetical protein